MSFLQPWLLAALPLMALPIIIHLINQRRYQTVPWGAMMFLLAANRMSRGYAKIRQWLILLFRTLAIAGLVFAISRPLASGWLGAAAGGGSETTIVLVDRSPSMTQRGDGTALTKLDSGIAQLDSTLETLGTGRIVLVDSGSPTPRELEPGEKLSDVATLGPTDATADLPAMLLSALDYVQANKVGQTDIWICSDLRESDWKPSDGRWQTIRETFQALPNRVRFSLLAFSDAAEDNTSIRVSSVRRLADEDAAEVLISLKLLAGSEAAGDTGTAVSIPVEIEVDGARSVLNATISGGAVEIKDHRIPVAKEPTLGWGRVSIPADANVGDNDYYFVYDQPPPRKTLVVSDDPVIGRSLELAAGIAPAEGVQVESTVLEPGQLNAVAWSEYCLVLWHGRLPEGSEAEEITRFAARGGAVMFFPSEQAGDESLFGIRYSGWDEPKDGLTVESWRGDSDLLSNTQSGASLPVGKLKVNGLTEIVGEGTPLATLAGGRSLLVRAPTTRGGVYFWATTPTIKDSSLATDGVVLYVSIQRAAAIGSGALKGTRELTAGVAGADESEQWQRVASAEDRLSTEQNLNGGIYKVNESLLAVNRGPEEDSMTVVADETLAGLFQGLDFDRIETSAGKLGGLVQEVWRLFLITMMISMLVEAALCLPKTSTAAPTGVAAIRAMGAGGTS